MQLVDGLELAAPDVRDSSIVHAFTERMPRWSWNGWQFASKRSPGTSVFRQLVEKLVRFSNFPNTSYTPSRGQEGATSGVLSAVEQAAWLVSTDESSCGRQICRLRRASRLQANRRSSHRSCVRRAWNTICSSTTSDAATSDLDCFDTVKQRTYRCQS